jgi:hypothetical protein
MLAELAGEPAAEKEANVAVAEATAEEVVMKLVGLQQRKWHQPRVVAVDATRSEIPSTGQLVAPTRTPSGSF